MITELVEKAKLILMGYFKIGEGNITGRGAARSLAKYFQSPR